MNDVSSAIAEAYDSYSIWALPRASMRAELEETIQRLSMEYGGPVFQPHLTILGDIRKSKEEVIKVAEDIARRSAHLHLRLGEPSFSTTYFQSVFIRVISSAKLLNLNLRGKRLLKLENNTYMPHVSVLYGSYRMIVREKAANSIRVQNTDCQVRQIAVVPSTDSPTEWNILHAVEVCG